MRKNHVKIIALAFALQIVLPGAGGQAVAQAGKAAYAAMAPLDQYLIPSERALKSRWPAALRRHLFPAMLK